MNMAQPLTDRRRAQLRRLGFAFLLIGLGSHALEQRLLHVRLTTSTWQRRAGLYLDNPGAIASLVGLALVRSGRPVPQRKG
jgi:hypothetical protein